jgi:ABC-2 type transport system permease protein
MNVAKTIAQFWLILRLQTRQAWFHRAAVLGIVMSWGLRMGITILLYQGIYKIIGTTSIKNISFQIAASSMILYAVYSVFGTRDISRIINNDYKSGAMEVWLNKPISYLVFKIAETLGKNIPATVTLTVVALGFLWIGGPKDIDHMLIRFLLGALLLFLGIVVGCLLYSLIGLSVVWLQDGTSAYWIVDKFVMVFGGAYIPVAFFPHDFRLIGESLPTGAVTFLSQIFYPDFFVNTPRFIATQLFWIAALGFSLFKASQAANKNLTVNGG